VTLGLVGIGGHDQGQDQTHHANDHQDQADGVDAESFRFDTHRPIQNGAESDQEEASSYSTRSQLGSFRRLRALFTPRP
jgi:hypothetical protein